MSTTETKNSPAVDLVEIAKRAGINMDCWDMGAASLAFSEGARGITREHFEKFAYLYGFVCWNAALAANPPHMQSFVSKAIGLQVDASHPYGRCTISGPAEDVAFIFEHLPDAPGA